LYEQEHCALCWNGKKRRIAEMILQSEKKKKRKSLTKRHLTDIHDYGKVIMSESDPVEFERRADQYYKRRL